jgi:hypothetical protein
MRHRICNICVFFHPKPTKVRATIQDWKQMMIVAFHKNRVLGYRILPKNTNVNFEVYLDF